MRLLILACLAACQGALAAKVKVALFPSAISGQVSMSPDFLRRIHTAGYTHILLHVEPTAATANEWTNGEYQCPVDASKCRMQDNLYRNFLAVGEWNKQAGADLKVIAHLGLGNKWVRYHYASANPRIKYHVFKDYQGAGQAMKEFGLGFFAKRSETGDMCPVYSKNPEYDKTVASHVRAVLLAYKNASASSTARLAARMEYIHLGFDESYTESGMSYGLERLEKLCFGNNVDDIYEMNRLHFADRGISANLQTCFDRWKSGTYPKPDDGKCTEWISSSHTTETALKWRHELLLDEVQQQILAIKSASNGISGQPLSGAKFMIWADVWDPQKAGGYFGFSRYIGRLAERLRSDLVMVPWQYSSFYQSPVEANVDVDIKYEYGTEIGGQIRGNFNATGHIYDSRAALQAFTSHNLPVLFGSALRAGNGYVENSCLRQVYNYSTACKENSLCLGYVAGIFGTKTTGAAYNPALGPYDQGAAYAILEILNVAERRSLGGVRIPGAQGKVTARAGYLNAPGLHFDGSTPSRQFLLAD